MTPPMPPSRNWRTRTLGAADEQLVAEVAAALEPCTHPESMWTHRTAAGRTVITCHRPGCGHIISDLPAACRTPFVIFGDPDRIALCALGRGHAEPNHQETP